MNRHRSQSFLIHLLALGLLVFFGLAGVSRAADPAPADSPPAARRTTLADLPPAAQYTVSAQFGRDDPAYHVDGSAPTPQANNPRQGLSASLSPTALQVRAGEIDWNLTLTGWGRDGALMRPALNPAPVQQANRVEYTNGDLTAWYVNGPLGLQQGWTVRERPAGEGELTLTLRSQGLAAQADADGRSLTLNDDHGMTHLRYAGLLAFDANGRELPARFVVEGEQVRLAVNDAGATYPLTIDPWVQVAKLATVADVGGGELGSAVAVSADGGTLVAGAPYNDTGGSNRGAVYMFVRPAGGWAGATETAKLTASDGANNDGLGITVAISADGSVVIASARGNDAGGSNRGAAYVFVRPAGGWADATETAKLTASDGADDDFLGSSVAISADGGTVVAGEHSNASYRGAAYVFVRPAGGWATATETAKLTASDGASFEYLGTAVAVSADGGVIVAGATYNASRGAAYVFVRPAGGWATATETAKLTANIGPNFDQLGSAVAVSGDGGTVIAGAPGTDFGGFNRGAAYVFVRPAGGWTNTTNQTARLTANGGANGDELGSAVAVSGDGGTVIAGAPGNNANRGTTYVFARPAGGWINASYTAKLTASDGANSDVLGSAVAISADGGTVVTGASGNDAGGFNRGAAYVFVRSAGGWATATETAKLISSGNGGAEGDALGYAVAASADGGTVVAGAPGTTGGSSRGTVYVFVRPAGGWATAAETAKLIASDGGNGDRLGSAVAVSGDGGTVIAGAPGTDFGGFNRGAAYVFIRPAGGWVDATETAKLTASDGANSDVLGSAVAVSADGGAVVAGAPYNAAGGYRRGAAYVFIRPAGGWVSVTETAKLTASDGADDDNLGQALVISADGGTVVAGASQFGEGGPTGSGATYVFIRSAGGWATATETAKLIASDGGNGDQLGSAVAVSADGGTVIAGAPGNDTSGSDNGAAYVFIRPVGGWINSFQTAKLTASDGADDDSLGSAVAVSADGGAVVAGAPYNAAGGYRRGAAYVFIRPAGGWATTTETDKLTTSDGADYDQFGSAVAISADGGTLGIGVNQVGNSYTPTGPGAVYVFDLISSTAPTLGIDSVSQAEGDSGTTAFTFTVTLSAAASAPVTVDWASADGTATAGSDYIAGSGTLTFPVGGPLTQTLTVQVTGDTTVEPDETFVVNLGNPTNATLAVAQGAGTIVNDDSPTLSINNVSQAEGNSGTTAFTFTVTLSAAASAPVTVDWASADGTATVADGDYIAGSGTLTFPVGGPLTQTLTVQVIGDTITESTETFVVNLGNPTNATLAVAQGTGTILNDDSPTLGIDSVSQAEGDSGTTAFTFTVTLSAAASAPVTVDWASADGTATVAGGDYIAGSGTLTFPVGGPLTQTLTVQVTGDTAVEPDETFVVNLGNPTNATLAVAQGTGTILNDDAIAGRAGIAWSGEQFVVVGDGGAIFTSADGATWTARTSGTTQDLHGIAWSGQGFVAVGEGGVILTSADGATWTDPVSGTTSALRAVAWSGDRFAAVGAGGTILTSADGLTWTDRTLPTGAADLYGVTWAGDRFAAVGAGGTILASADGAAWTAHVSGTTDDLYGVAWVGGQWAAVGSGGAVLTSATGAAWTTHVSGTTDDLYGVAWSGGHFAAVGGGGALLTSPDGAAWTAHDVGTTDDLHGVAWSGDRFLAVGANATRVTFARPWGDERSLIRDRWTLVGPPAEPPAPATVRGAFETRPSGAYGADWTAWRRDANADQYVLLESSDPVAPGVGYWLRQGHADAATLALTVGSAAPVAFGNPNCPSTAGCHEIALTALAGDALFNLVGMPFPYPVGWWEVRVEVDGVAYPLDAARDPVTQARYVAPTYWVWNGNGYDAHDGHTPGMVGLLQPWQGVWVQVEAASFGHTVKLLIPRIPKYGHVPAVPTTPAAPASRPIEGGPALLDWLIAPAVAEPAPADRAWHVRLIVEEPTLGLRDRNNVLGQLADGAVGYDVHDLPELAPFGSPFLTVVFPHPDWGPRAGDYASDYRPDRDLRAPGRPAADWRFELRADRAGYPARLRWEGPPDVLSRSELLDEDTGARYPADDPAALRDGAPATLTTPTRRFIWRFVGQPRLEP